MTTLLILTLLGSAELLAYIADRQECNASPCQLFSQQETVLGDVQAEAVQWHSQSQGRE